ncbi:hypothetical protein FDA48_05830 [Clostridium botulinum]|nr:hypothetical protein [Clostridium botulinum]
MRKILILLLLGISIFSVGCGRSDNNVSTISNNKEIEETKTKLDKDNAINIEYDNNNYKEIQDVFINNKLQAQNKYINKTVKITGEVKKITTTDGTIKVVIMAPNRFKVAFLEFKNTKENESKIMDLKTYNKDNDTKGNLITVYGCFTGIDDVNMLIENCEFA